MKERLIESLKNITIVLLSCTLLLLTLFAIPAPSIEDRPWLAGLLQPVAPLLGLSEAELTQVAQAQSVRDAARPIAVSVMAEGGRHTAMWDRNALDATFERFAPHLRIALDSAGQFAYTSTEQVQAALSDRSVYLRYPAPLPASLIASWLGTSLEAAVGEVDTCILSAAGDTVQLYLLGPNVSYCANTGTEPDLLRTLLQTFLPDGSAFAFETDYDLAPLSLLPGAAPAVPAITASASCDSRYIDALATAMGFNPYGESRYTDDRGNVRFSETGASLEIDPGGKITYRGESRRFTADSDQPEALAETARQLTELIFRDVPGEGRLYLTGFSQEGGTTVCRFNYMLSGIPLCVANDAATITFTENTVTEAVVQVWSFTGTGKTVYPLPIPQAAAMLPKGSALEMGYCINTDLTLSAGWLG
ncbi:MAG: hypothetical protein IJO88_06855 [Oscillospiraceae bacterium]|nr:hypothetical protein [Clostridia bacterium]MBQ9968422.1 hypothetical protein [Oscillospiraceae bacterium]